MPLPTPNADEDKPEFIGRCMANDVMKDDFPDTDQRYAVCNSQWRKSKSRQSKPHGKGWLQ